MENIISHATLISDLTGRWEVQENPRPVRRRGHGIQNLEPVHLAQGRINPFGLPFKEAIEFFGKKEVVRPEVFNRLKEAHRTRAFTVKGLQDEYVLESIKEALLDALEEGLTTRDFIEGIEDLFETRGLGRPPGDWHLQTVFRTNTQAAYQAGHYQQMRQVRDTRPFWQYLTVGDDRVRLAHLELHGIVRRADDPFWLKWYPPNGFNCRCTVVSLSMEEMEEEDLRIETRPWPELPDEGFRTSPVEWLGIDIT